MNPPKKLRCVLLYSSGHLGSTTVFNKMMEMDEIEIVGLVRAEPFRLNWSSIKKSYRQLKKLGWRFSVLLIWQRIVQMLVLLLTRLLPWRKKYRPGWALAAKHGIPVLSTVSINNADSQQWLAERKPDIVVSAFFTQILKQSVIDIPKKGVLNIHPGWLPTYRGAMVYFWSLLRKERYAGVSVHWIDTGIDTGALLARKKIPLNKRSTQERVVYIAAVIGSRLLQRVFRELQYEKSPAEITVNNEQANYYSMPKRNEFLYYWKEHRFFRIRDMFRLLCSKA